MMLAVQEAYDRGNVVSLAVRRTQFGDLPHVRCLPGMTTRKRNWWPFVIFEGPCFRSYYPVHRYFYRLFFVSESLLGIDCELMA